MIRSIPPNIRSPKSTVPAQKRDYRAKPYVHYTCMPSKTLENLLVKAQQLASEQNEIVKLLPDDEEIGKLDKLQRLILQIKNQIAVRKMK